MLHLCFQRKTSSFRRPHEHSEEEEPPLTGTYMDIVCCMAVCMVFRSRGLPSDMFARTANCVILRPLKRECTSRFPRPRRATERPRAKLRKAILASHELQRRLLRLFSKNSSRSFSTNEGGGDPPLWTWLPWLSQPPLPPDRRSFCFAQLTVVLYSVGRFRLYPNWDY